MSGAVRWLVTARQDRARIVAMIRSDDLLAAARVGDEIVRQASRLSEFPFLGRTGRVEGTRELSISRTPYIVVYRVVSGAEVDILRILHARQNWPPSDI